MNDTSPEIYVKSVRALCNCAIRIFGESAHHLEEYVASIESDAKAGRSSKSIGEAKRFFRDVWEGTYDTETPETLAIFDEEFSKVEGFDVDLMLDGWPTKVVQKVQARGRIRTEDEARACIAFRDFFGEEALGDPEFWVMLDDYLVA